MGDSSQAPRSKYNTKEQGKKPAWTAIQGVFESIEGYIKKSRDQPSLKEIQTDLHAAENANKTLRRDVTLIKNTLDSLAGGLATAPSNSHSMPMRTRVQNIKPPMQQLAQAIAKNCEITVKINDPSPSSQVRRATRVQIMELVNGAISRSKHRDLQDPQIQIRAIKRHPSGDLTLYTDCKEPQTSSSNTNLYGKTRTELDSSDTIEIENRIKKDNLSVRVALQGATGGVPSAR
ncbi:MAG: hypothetical protein M1839_004113 [Geoglossum umbratile]|nr:MAG: hypothetical protein M1839_004113 [Geoglossum umbratile]